MFSFSLFIHLGMNIYLGKKKNLINLLRYLLLFWQEQCILVSEEDEEATFVDPALRGKCVFINFLFVFLLTCL